MRQAPRIARIPALLAVLLTVAAGPAVAGHQKLFEGPLRLAGFTHQSIEFHVPGEWMRKPRLEGRIEASGGGGNDIEALVLHQADFAAWERRGRTTPLFDAGRRTTIEFSVPLPGPGAFVIVLSNRFSKVSAKQIQGRIALVWDEDPSLPAGQDLRSRVRFLRLPERLERFAVRASAEDTTSLVVFERGGDQAPYAITVQRVEGGATVQRSVGTYAGAVEEIGTVDLYGDADRAVFLAGVARDSAGARRDLVVVSPRQSGMIGLSLIAAADGASAPAERSSADYDRPRFSIEQSFLERIKFAYGAARPAGRSADTPAAAGEGSGVEFVEWMRDNGALRDGPMTIRRYHGPPDAFGPAVARVAIGAVTYTAYRGYGVMGFESGTRERFAVFHPAQREAWPTALAKSGSWLVIGTRGEGLAFVDTRTFHLKRVRHGAAIDTVQTLEVMVDGVRVNGTTIVSLPAE